MKTSQINQRTWKERIVHIALFTFHFSLFVLLFSSCTRIELEDMPPPTPQKGKLTLTTNWSKRTEGIAIPSSYTVRVGDNTAQLSGQTNEYPNLFPEGVYRLYIYHDAEKMTISGATATVNTTSGIVEPMPGWLFTTKKEVAITAGNTQAVSVEMKQEVCRLDIELTITEGDPARIAGITATLAGVASAWNFDTDSPVGNAASVKPEFTKNSNKITASVRLLGIVPTTAQELILIVTFSDNSTQTIVKDLSSLLTDFNADQHIAVLITANMQTPIEAGFKASITEWKSASGGTGIAN